MRAERCDGQGRYGTIRLALVNEAWLCGYGRVFVGGWLPVHMCECLGIWERRRRRAVGMQRQRQCCLGRPAGTRRSPKTTPCPSLLPAVPVLPFSGRVWGAAAPGDSRSNHERPHRSRRQGGGRRWVCELPGVRRHWLAGGMVVGLPPMAPMTPAPAAPGFSCTGGAQGG